ncbi:MAG TPA: hypothetical protein VEC76_19830 [Streptosporangiaceae bacterium]|nr:hypothetical protein [Streptosporangiaceae bacterium]
MALPEAQGPRERRFEPDDDQLGQMRELGDQQCRLPHGRRRGEPVQDPGEPVASRLNGVHRRVQRPAQDIVEVVSSLCRPRRVRPIPAITRAHGSISTII